MKRCPLCAEEIRDEAIKCRFCGSELLLDPAAGSTPVWAPPAPSSVSGLAIASLVMGVSFFYWIGSILALIFGYAAKKQIDREAGKLTGRGMAVGGIVLGWIEIGGGVALAVIGLVAYFSLSK